MCGFHCKNRVAAHRSLKGTEKRVNCTATGKSCAVVRNLPEDQSCVPFAQTKRLNLLFTKRMQKFVVSSSSDWGKIVWELLSKQLKGKLVTCSFLHKYAGETPLKGMAAEAHISCRVLSGPAHISSQHLQVIDSCSGDYSSSVLQILLKMITGITLLMSFCAFIIYP